MNAANPAAIQCGACGRAYTGTSWSGLASLLTLDGAELRTYVSVWPANAVVEVRACATCRCAISRLVCVA